MRRHRGSGLRGQNGGRHGKGAISELRRRRNRREALVKHGSLQLHALDVTLRVKDLEV